MCRRTLSPRSWRRPYDRSYAPCPETSFTVPVDTDSGGLDTSEAATHPETRPSQGPSESPTQAPPAVETGRGEPSTVLTVATIGATIAVILSITSFILYIYYYERITSPGESIESFGRLYDILKVSFYCESFAWIAVVTAVILTIKGLVACGLKTSIALLKSLDVQAVLMTAIALLIVLVAATVALILAYEFSEHLNEDGDEIVSRIFAYGTDIAAIIESWLVLIVVDGLRKASMRPPNPAPVVIPERLIADVKEGAG